MTDKPEHADDMPAEGDVPVEGEPLAEELAPRRAASAEFVVEASIGSQALLREAMDPANQSLREALRLSFRVLQVVILILIILFVFSGFQTVDDGESGVMLRWGKILPVDNAGALTPGLKFSKWPYPAGEFVLFPDEHRTVGLGDAYWPRIKEGQSRQEAIEHATIFQQLNPGKDGVLLTRGADVAHLKLIGDYEIYEPVAFVNCVENASPRAERLDADRLVELALQRAAVHTAARLDLQQFVDFAEPEQEMLMGTAQALLDEVRCGIHLRSIDTPVEPMPALAIEKTFSELQIRKTTARSMIERARGEAGTMLFSAAGADYQVLVDLIDDYEAALNIGDDEQADRLLSAINAQLESEQAGGEVARIIVRAKSYRSEIERTLGFEARRFNSLLPTYRDNPKLVISQLWSETYRTVLQAPGVERIFVPDLISRVGLDVAGQDPIRQDRRRQSLERADVGGERGPGYDEPYFRRASDMTRRLEGRAGRQLSETGESRRSDR